MGTMRQWNRALADAGFDKDGNPKQFPIPAIKDTRWFINRFIYFWPFLIIFTGIFLMSHYPAYIGIPAAALVSYLMQLAAQKLLLYAPSNMRSVHHTVSFQFIVIEVGTTDKCIAFSGRRLLWYAVLGWFSMDNDSPPMYVYSNSVSLP